MNTLKQAREKAGMTQIQVAEMVDISERGYQKIESGEQMPNVVTAQKLARLLNSTVEKLFPVDIEKESSLTAKQKKLYDVDEFREVFGNKISKSTIYNKIKIGEIKAVHVGRKPFIPAWFVEELLTSRNI